MMTFLYPQIKESAKMPISSSQDNFWCMSSWPIEQDNKDSQSTISRGFN